MKTLFIVVCLGVLVLNCSFIHNDNSNYNSMNRQIYNLQVHNFSEIPQNLLENLDKMGIDTSSILNKYEGEYLNFIFNVESQDFNLIGKKVGFSRSKIDYFRDTHERFYRNDGTVGGSALYIFDATQKEESGGYDAAIIYWSKFLLPIETVVKRLKNKPAGADLQSVPQEPKIKTNEKR